MKELSAPLSKFPACCPPCEFPAITEREIRAIAWNACGILRNGPELSAANKKLRSRTFGPLENPVRADYERRNLHQIATLLSQAALAREESRGGHYRIDFPTKSKAFEKHSLLQRGHTNVDAEVTFR
jgi:L-aspartate oxidase